MLHHRSFHSAIALSAIATTITTVAASADSAFLFKRVEPSDAEPSTTSKKAVVSADPHTTTTKKRDTTTVAKATESAIKAESSKAVASNHRTLSATHKSVSDTLSLNGISTLPATASRSSTGTSPTSTLSGQLGDKHAPGLSVGAIVGIAVGAAVLLGLIAALVASRRRKKREQRYKTRMMKPDPFTMGFGSHDPAPAPRPPLTVSAPHVAFNMTPPTPMVQTPPIALASPSLPPGSPPTTVTTTTTTTTLAPNHNTNRSIGIFTVVSTYTPTLSDELDIQAGDKVEIFIEYDDGWCQGVNLSRGAVKGVFPKHCVDYYQNQQQQQHSSDNMKRVSSMYMTQTSYYM